MNVLRRECSGKERIESAEGLVPRGEKPEDAGTGEVDRRE
jgi:hypothetical protein